MMCRGNLKPRLGQLEELDKVPRAKLATSVRDHKQLSACGIQRRRIDHHWHRYRYLRRLNQPVKASDNLSGKRRRRLHNEHRFHSAPFCTDLFQ